MFYVSSHWRVACRVLLVCLYCALAVSVRADYGGNSGAGPWLQFNYDGCSPAYVTLTYSFYARYYSREDETYYNEWASSHVQSTATFYCVPGENDIAPFPAGSNGDPVQSYSSSIYVDSVTGNSNAPTGWMPAQSVNVAAGGVTSGPCTETYSPTVPNPCAGSSGVSDCGTVDQFQAGTEQTDPNGLPYAGFSITNNSGAPMSLGNGQYLQPGQSYPVSGPYVPEGTNYGIYSAALVGSGGDVTTGFTFSYNGTNGSYYTYPASTSGATVAALTSTNDGPILWTSSTSTNAALATEAGMSAIVNGQNMSDFIINNDNSNLISALNAGISNLLHNTNSSTVVQFPTNFSGGQSNVWVENPQSNVWVQNFPLTNDNEAGLFGMSNLLAGNSALLTNQANGMLSPMNGAASAIAGGLPDGVVDHDGADDLPDITVGDPAKGTVTFSLIAFPSGMSSYYTAMRSVIAWALVVGSILWNTKFAYQKWSDIIRTSGVKGLSTGPISDQLGGQAVVALIIAALILAMITAFPVVVVGLLAGELSFMSGLTSAATFLGGAGAPLDWLDQVFPIWVLVSTSAVEVVFFYAVVFVGSVIQTAIRLTPGA